MKRDYSIDHLRGIVILLVLAYHVCYLFNTVGCVSSIGVTGIRAFDVLEYTVYPWFMAILFVLAGISARYSLTKRGAKGFWHERVRKLLVPSIGSLFLLSWITGLITTQYVDVFGGNGAMVPAPFKYLIYCAVGIGPAWFMHELLLASLVLLLIRAIDRKDALSSLGKKAANLPVLLLLVFAVWGSAQILNMPMLVMYRNGIYVLMFLLGYYVFSNGAALDVLAKWRWPLIAAAAALAAAFTVRYWGTNFASDEALRGILGNAFTWAAILALLGAARHWLSRESAFTRFMTPRSFAFYILHYPVLCVSGWLFGTVLCLPMGVCYLLQVIVLAVTMPLLYEGVHRVPGLRYWLLGIKAAKKPAEASTPKQ